MAQKNNNKFEGYQKDKVDARKHILQAHLDQLRKSRSKFTYITELAAYVAEMITESERSIFTNASKNDLSSFWPVPKSCNKSTLLRNVTYRALLSEFMVDSLSKGISSKTAMTRSIAENEAKFREKDLCISNQINQIKRLKFHIENLSEKLNSKNNVENSLLEVNQEENNLQYANNAALLYKTIVMIIDHYKELISIDLESSQILDPSLRRDNVVVGAKIAKPFFEMYKKLKV